MTSTGPGRMYQTRYLPLFTGLSAGFRLTVGQAATQQMRKQ